MQGQSLLLFGKPSLSSSFYSRRNKERSPINTRRSPTPDFFQRNLWLRSSSESPHARPSFPVLEEPPLAVTVARTVGAIPVTIPRPPWSSSNDTSPPWSSSVGTTGAGVGVTEGRSRLPWCQLLPFHFPEPLGFGSRIHTICHPYYSHTVLLSLKG